VRARGGDRADRARTARLLIECRNRPLAETLAPRSAL